MYRVADPEGNIVGHYLPIREALRTLVDHLYEEGYALPDDSPVYKYEDILLKPTSPTTFEAYLQRQDRIFDTKFRLEQVLN